MATQTERVGGTGESVFSGQHDRRKVTDWVYEEIKAAIVDLRLAPGHPLREAALAAQLGVSKTPIREALTRLEQEGLVETMSFKGAVVTGYSRQDLSATSELKATGCQ
jgi:DNA-binding GntR family transcriptional regulator